MADIPTTLRQQWERDLDALGASSIPAEKVLTDIVARHNETHRRYHNQRHLISLFAFLVCFAVAFPGRPTSLPPYGSIHRRFSRVRQREHGTLR